MAHEDYSAVWAIPGLSTSERHFLLNLLWHRNDQTGNCYPGIRRIMRETGLSNRFVLDTIGKLVASKVLDVRKRKTDKGDNDVNHYKLLLDTENSRRLNGLDAIGQAGEGFGKPAGGGEVSLPPSGLRGDLRTGGGEVSSTRVVKSLQQGGELTSTRVVKSLHQNSEAELGSEQTSLTNGPSGRVVGGTSYKPFKAKFKGRCISCKEWYQPGEQIIRSGKLSNGKQVYKHSACAKAPVQPAPAPAPQASAPQKPQAPLPSPPSPPRPPVPLAPAKKAVRDCGVCEGTGKDKTFGFECLCVTLGRNPDFPEHMMHASRLGVLKCRKCGGKRTYGEDGFAECPTCHHPSSASFWQKVESESGAAK